MGQPEHNLFYWFFKNADPAAPLLLWINGGPGATSLFGLFLEHGPLRVTRNGTGSDDFELSKADVAWADTYNVIYLDQPVGTGFSYGESYVSDNHVGSADFRSFLLQFFAQYPEFSTRAFYLTGESYGGKFLSLYTHDILEYNKQ